MDTVRAVLIVLPGEPLPDPAAAAAADAVVLVAPQDAADFAAERERAAELARRTERLYLAPPTIGSGDARAYLMSTLQPGVYGVAARAPSSVEQLRYLESLLEDLEIRADIRPGLTAIAVGFDHPRALTFMSDALTGMRESADRMTWIAFNHESLAATLGVPLESATVAQAGSQAVLTAAAFDLPVVSGSTADAEAHAALGFRGAATDDPADLERLRTVFDRPEPDATEEEEP